MNKVIVYSADWCGYCHALMDWLTDSGIAYEEKNGEKESWITGYPTTEIVNQDGKRLALIEGFDRQKILAAIKGPDAKK
ncbi:hypothetical protein FWG86_00545 [Candidatus Saccharibacteria bacterium]|nr:hypothetical protein [Candidatus Saccharibacteria bacterium]